MTKERDTHPALRVIAALSVLAAVSATIIGGMILALPWWASTVRGIGVGTEIEALIFALPVVLGALVVYAVSGRR
jgi:hypothetical protein